MVQYAATTSHYQPTAAPRVDVRAPAASLPTTAELGFDHLRAGPDHPLFVLLLGLGALRRGSRLRSAAGHVVALTAIFTLGHGLSLAVVTLGWVVLPSQWIEVGIAVTILLEALNAARPWLRARSELAITGGSSLVHGLGFGGWVLDEPGVQPARSQSWPTPFRRRPSSSPSVSCWSGSSASASIVSRPWTTRPSTSSHR